MAYSKLFKVVADYAVGIGFVNGLIDNNAAIWDMYAAEHRAPGEPVAAASFEPEGRHDTLKVARAVAQYAVESPMGIAVSYLLTPYPAKRMSPMGATGTGAWDFRVERLGIVGAIATPHKGDATPRKASVTRRVLADGTQALHVQTWELSAGAFVASEYDFTLTMWCTS